MTGFEAFGKITSISDVYIEEAAFENESAPGVVLMPRRGILSGIASFFGSAAGSA